MTLPQRRTTWLTRPRVVGTPLHWARHAAGLGASAAASGCGLLMAHDIYRWLRYGFSLDFIGIELAIFAVLIAASAGIGAAAGLVHPLVLDRVRGRFPLPMIAAGATALGAAAGVGALGTLLAPLALAAGGPDPSSMGFVVLLSAGIGAAATTLWWLPFTLATVTGRRWPVTRIAGPAGALLVLATVFALGL